MDAEVYVSDFVFSLAHEARRTSLVTALRQQRGALTLARLHELLGSRRYGDDLARLTIEELLAESSGVELDVIEQIERGDGGSVNLDTLRKLASALDLPLHALVDGLQDDRIDSGPFGPRLTQLRERRGWSRAQLAESSGLAVEMIEQIELEQFSPRLSELRQLAGALDLQVSELFEDMEPTVRSQPHRCGPRHLRHALLAVDRRLETP